MTGAGKEPGMNWDGAKAENREDAIPAARTTDGAGRGRWLSVGMKAVGAVLAVAAAAAVVLGVILSSEPPALSDAQALEDLPAGAEILARHEQSQGRVQVLEYRYEQQHAYCVLELTEQRAFRYARGIWRADAQGEVLAEREDWSALAGTWTETAAGPGGRSITLEITAFAGGELTGTIAYQDASSGCQGPAEDYFSPGRRLDGSQAYLLDGTGYFRYAHLRIDPDTGVYFDNAQAPMEKTDLPAGGSWLMTGRHDRLPEELAPPPA